MSYLFISDIHGITSGLNLIEEKIKNSDILVVLGDLYNASEKCNKEVDLFLNKYKHKLILIKGNCDNTNSDLIKTIKINNKNVILTHGHLLSDTKQLNDENNIIIFGHKHIPFVKKINNNIYICVGSISLPRNEIGETFMIYENNNFKIFDLDLNLVDGITI